MLEDIKKELELVQKEIKKFEKIVYVSTEFEDHYLPYTNTVNGGK